MLRSKYIGTFDTARQAKAARIQMVLRELGAVAAALESDTDLSDDDFIQAAKVPAPKRKSKPKRGEAPRGCVYRRPNGRWCIELGHKFLGAFVSENEARAVLAKAIEAKMRKVQEENDSHIVARTEDGIAYLEAISGEKVLVDDDVYWRFRLYSVHMHKYGYPVVSSQSLHSLVMEVEDGHDVIDHISRNKLDNRRFFVLQLTRQTIATRLQRTEQVASESQKGTTVTSRLQCGTLLSFLLNTTSALLTPRTMPSNGALLSIAAFTLKIRSDFTLFRTCMSRILFAVFLLAFILSRVHCHYSLVCRAAHSLSLLVR